MAAVAGGVALVVAATTPAPAPVRIATGQDLYDACKLSVEFRVRPTSERTPPGARYCRQYLDGYFGSLDALHQHEQAHKVHPHDEADRIQCARIPQSASFDQLEQQIVRYGDWHPELMDRPAVELIMGAFDTLDPC